MNSLKLVRRGSRLVTGVIALACAPAAMAHDFWLQPRTYNVAAGVDDPLTIQVGHGPFRTRWSGQLERVVLFRDIGPGGATDIRGAFRPRGSDIDAMLSFATPGTHVLVFQSNYAESDLPAIRYNDYAKVEGLTPALDLRAQSKTTDTPGREIYSRRCKALVQVGGTSGKPQPQVTTPVGLSLEIVPEKDPYTLGPGEPLPVRIIYDGHPLAGALVKLTSLEFDRSPVEMHRSDAQGRAAFKVPRTGTWLINVIWTKPIKGNPKADFDTTFSSLTFGYAATPVASVQR